MNDDVQRGSKRDLQNMVLRSSAWLVGARIGRILVTLAGTALLSRLLTPSDFGLFFFATTSVVLVVVVLEGFVDLPVTRSDRLPADAIATLTWSSLALVTMFSMLVWFAAPMLERAVGFANLATTLRLAIPAFISQVPLMVGMAILKRQHRFGLVAVTQVLNVAIYILLACILVLFDYGVVALLIAFNIAQMVTAAIAAIAARIPIAPPKRFVFPAGFAGGGLGALSRFVAWVWTNVDTVAVSLLFGPAVTGLYSRAYNLNVQAKEPFAAVDQPIRQAFAAMRDRTGGIVTPAVMALRLLTVLSAMTAGSMIILRDQIILVLLGDQWIEAALPLAVLAASLPARVALLYIDSVTITTGDMRTLLARNVAVLMLIVAGLAIFAPFGLAYVAAVVACALYASLMMSGLAFGSGSGLMLGHIIRALGPGLTVLVIMVLSGYAVDLATLSFVGGTVAKLLLIITAATIVALAAPDRWLTPALAKARARVLGRSLPTV